VSVFVEVAPAQGTGTRPKRIWPPAETFSVPCEAGGIAAETTFVAGL
jgi:hypothetical protein